MKRVLMLASLLFISGFGFNNVVQNQTTISKLLTATVEISVQENSKDEFTHAGTGWLYDNQTTIVTAKHVVDGYDKLVKSKDGANKIEHMPYSAVRITFSNGDKSIISKIKFSKNYDIAVMILDEKSIKINRAPLTLASKRPEIGEKLFGAGYPFDYECLLLLGNVTGYHIEKEVPALKGEYLVTNAMFSPGNSGGAIVNESCEVIGVVDWVDMRGASFSFAIPIDILKKAIEEAS